MIQLIVIGQNMFDVILFSIKCGDSRLLSTKE